jgi:tRNA(Ile)-lysidine synthase
MRQNEGLGGQSPPASPHERGDVPASDLRQHVDDALRAVLGDGGGLLLIAVSGGADSMALWDLVAGSPRWSVAIYHLDHQLRSDAPEDATVIRQRAEAYAHDGRTGMPLFIERCDIAACAVRWRCSAELAGRRQRYARLLALAGELGAVAVVTAHHRDDQAETVLGNLLRGAGPIGRAGIAAHRPLAPGLPVIRPLLGIARAQLHAYARQRELVWRDDSTNADTRLRRNFLRLRVLPALEQGCPGITDALVALSEREQVELARHADRTHALWSQSCSGQRLALAELTTADEEERTRIWRLLLVHLAVHPQRRHLTALDRLALGPIGGQVTLGQWLVARRRAGLAWQAQHPTAAQDCIAIAAPGHVSRGGETLACRIEPVRHPISRDPRIAELDERAVAWPLAWRQSRPGERWRPLGCPGRQTVIKYLAQRGVASRIRPLIAVVADRNGVLWIPGHGIAERAKVHNMTTQVVRLEAGSACQPEGGVNVARAPSLESSHGLG